MKFVALLLAASITGQIARGQVGFAQPNLPNAQPNLSNDRDFGWQISKDDGRLEYIIQISPDKLRLMQPQSGEATGAQELPSDLPPELVGRVARIVVRIGTAPVPRSPPLSEIQRTVQPIIAATDLYDVLEPGKFSDVESIVKVQNPAIPPYPGSDSSRFPRTNPLDFDNHVTSPGERFLDRSRQTGGVAGALSAQGSMNNDRALADVMGTASGQHLDSGGEHAHTHDEPPSANTGKFESTANNRVGAAEGPRGVPPINQRGVDAWPRPPTANQEANRIGDARSSIPPTGDPYRSPPSLATNDGFAGPPPVRTPTPNFGSPPGLTQQYANPGNVPPRRGDEGYGPAYAQPGYGEQNDPRIAFGSQQPNSATTMGQYSPNSFGGNQVTKPPADIPPATDPPSKNSSEGTGTDSDGAGDTTDVTNTASQNRPLVFFLLFSIVVNGYLGYLIGRLRHRYRSLLSNLRSQTT